MNWHQMCFVVHQLNPKSKECTHLDSYSYMALSLNHQHYAMKLNSRGTHRFQSTSLRTTSISRFLHPLQLFPSSFNSGWWYIDKLWTYSALNSTISIWPHQWMHERAKTYYLLDLKPLCTIYDWVIHTLW